MYQTFPFSNIPMLDTVTSSINYLAYELTILLVSSLNISPYILIIIIISILCVIKIVRRVWNLLCDKKKVDDILTVKKWILLKI